MFTAGSRATLRPNQRLAQVGLASIPTTYAPMLKSINILSTPATKSLKSRSTITSASSQISASAYSVCLASPQSCAQSASQPANHVSGIIQVQSNQAAGVAALFSFANDSVSIAASIILFPLMIDVVQMTIFLRPSEPSG